MKVSVTILLVLWLLPATTSAFDFTANTVAEGFNHPQHVAAADLDGDGDTDLLGTSYSGDDIAWWENDTGAGTSWTGHLIAGNFDAAKTASPADVDGDGDLDVIGAALLDGRVAWWENTLDEGGTEAWGRHVVDSNFIGANEAIGADLDGDGDIDILAAARFSDQVAWWENVDGVGLDWVKHLIDDNYDFVVSVVAADMDGDSDLDVVAAAHWSGHIGWWENVNGNGSAWTQRAVDTGFEGVRDVIAVDADTDGDLDIVAAAVFLGVSWWRNEDGVGGTWSQHVIDPDFHHAYGVGAGDLDGDDDIDLLGAAYIDDSIKIWENAPGGLVEHVLTDNFNGARSVCVADIDGDSDMDIAGAAELAHRITWWRQTGAPGHDPVEVDIYTLEQDTLPAQGGTLPFGVHVVSYLPGTYEDILFWTKLKLPNGNFYSQIQYARQFTMPPFMDFTGVIEQTIPGFAPAGVYQLWGWVGEGPNLPPYFSGFADFYKGDEATIAPGGIRFTSTGRRTEPDGIRFTLVPTGSIH